MINFLACQIIIVDTIYSSLKVLSNFLLLAQVTINDNGLNKNSCSFRIAIGVLRLYWGYVHAHFGGILVLYWNAIGFLFCAFLSSCLFDQSSFITDLQAPALSWLWCMTWIWVILKHIIRYICYHQETLSASCCLMWRNRVNDSRKHILWELEERNSGGTSVRIKSLLVAFSSPPKVKSSHFGGREANITATSSGQSTSVGKLSYRIYY